MRHDAHVTRALLPFLLVPAAITSPGCGGEATDTNPAAPAAVVSPQPVPAATPPAGGPCTLPFPVPVLQVTDRFEVDQFVDFRLSVRNWTAYPDALFAPSPDLPPCGLNTNASRTWIEIFAADGRRAYGYCGITSAQQLSGTMYAPFPRASALPLGVYIEMRDRLCDRTVVSNVAPLIR